MSTEKEIREAIDDYRNDRLVRAAARVGPA